MIFSLFSIKAGILVSAPSLSLKPPLLVCAAAAGGWDGWMMAGKPEAFISPSCASGRKCSTGAVIQQDQDAAAAAAHGDSGAIYK